MNKRKVIEDVICGIAVLVLGYIYAVIFLSL